MKFADKINTPNGIAKVIRIDGEKIEVMYPNFQKEWIWKEFITELNEVKE